MGVKYVEAFGDSLLIVQQVSGAYQYLEGSLNAYVDKGLGIIKCFKDFSIHHIARHESCKANDLAQGASGYVIQNKKFHVKQKPMLTDVEILLYTGIDG